MNISILTPDRQVFIGSIESVTVPGTSGLFQVKQNHAPLVSSLSSGSVKVMTSGEYALYNADKGELQEGLTDRREITFSIEGGFIEVLRNEISLLVQGVDKLS
ncbi:MAG: hypothetical protein AAF741_12710 [Bacteroidota bacterium]